jgi:rhodanese-related sulfurtransferase
MRLFFRIAVLGAGTLCTGVLINQWIDHGIHWRVLMFSLPRFSHSQEFNYISADSAYTLFVQRKGIFVDVRYPDDFSLDHIPGARSAPLLKIMERPELFREVDFDSMMICYGFEPEDEKAKRAADLLKRNSFSQVFILQGGFAEWIEMGYPVERADPQ